MHPEDCSCELCHGGNIPKGNLEGLAEGGEVESEESSDDGEIKDAVGKEMMESIHSKDHKRLMGAIEAAILHHMSKKED